MRRPAFVLAVVLPLAGLLGLYLADSAHDRGAVGRATSASRPASRRNPTAPREAVNVGTARSRDFFKEDPDEAVVGGETVAFQRGLFAARTAEGAGDGVVEATDVTWLSNPRPRSAAELERLVRVDPRLSGGDAGDAVRAGFGLVPSLRAARARVVGGTRLRTLERLELFGEVRATFVDPETPGERIDLAADDLAVDFMDGHPVSATSDGDVKLTRPARGDAEVSGRGVVVQFGSSADGRRTLRSVTVRDRIVVDLFDPGTADVRGPPIHARAQGPVTWTPAPIGASRPAGASGTIELAGGVEGERGTMRFEAATARVAWAAEGGRVESFEGRGGVSVVDVDFAVHGERMVLDPRRGRRATMYGAPIRATILGKHLPGAADADSTLACSGPLTIEPSSDPFPQAVDVLRLHASTAVSLASGTSRLAADDATLWVGAVGEARRRLPLKAFFAGRVSGGTDEAEWTAGELSFEREYDVEGVPRLETLSLKKNYRAAFFGRTLFAGARATSRSANAESGPASRVFQSGAFGLVRSADRLVIEGADRFEASRTPLDDEPLLVGVRGGAELRLEDAATNAVAARLKCGRASLVLRPETRLGPEGVVTLRRVESVGAEQGVFIEVPGVVEAKGELLRLRPEEEEVVLGGVRGARAEVTVRRAADPRAGPAVKGFEDVFGAESFTWTSTLARLVAEGAIRATFLAPTLPWIGDGPAKPADAVTSLSATKASVFFDDLAAGGGVREWNAAGPIVVKQPGRHLEASTFYFDVARREGLITGTPLLYRATRTEQGLAVEDRVEAPRASLFGESFTVDGPVKALLHISPARSALRIGPTRADEPPAPTSFAPVDVYCATTASFRPDMVRLVGRATAKQGDPLKDGFSAASDDAVFFFSPRSAGTSSVDLALAILSGSAVFRSERLEAAGDVVKLDRTARRLTLYNERPEPVTFRVNTQALAAPMTAGASGLTAEFEGEKVLITLLDVSGRTDSSASRPGAGR
jgi:hypothetical protein